MPFINDLKKAHSILWLLLTATLLFSSCDTVKRFLSTDLEEEDYSLGELYVDEYVKEVPYVPTPSAEAKAEGRINALGTEREVGDNEALYNAIQSWMGTPYQFGGSTKAGVDCSGFVSNIYQEVYQRTLHRVANDMQLDCILISRSELQEGDLVFFTNSKGRVSHVGIFLKNDIFAHSSTSRGVIISRLGDSYWSKHFYKGCRVKDS
jgi:cell wall-associated NlpC family hydrolase